MSYMTAAFDVIIQWILTNHKLHVCKSVLPSAESHAPAGNAHKLLSAAGHYATAACTPTVLELRATTNNDVYG